ncbi:sulfotransferase 2A1-like [Gracilinanus agilis]|uniref:sulfotransferase 2A1-like n=1 Tax=Gracilinanus agilis TaxID=191870 RepID=UPI001CFE60E9|nr:sulfotransferase 2A1-like [Gracilinanus agilis]
MGAVNTGLSWVGVGGTPSTFEAPLCEVGAGAASTLNCHLGSSGKMSGKYFTYKDLLFLGGCCSPEALQFIEEEFQVQEDDIFNVTFPKSGSFWMTEILCLIRSMGDVSWVHSVPNWERVPWIEAAFGWKNLLALPQPRLLSSHLPIQFFPKSFFQSRAKVIYTARDPRDVCASFFHFSKIMKLYQEPESSEAFIEEFLSGAVPFGSWFDHVKGWLGLKEQSNFLLVTYEELKKDIRGSIERIAKFLGVDLNRAALEQVVDNCSFQKMKENPMSNFSLLPPNYMNHGQGTFYRKGVCGEWKNFLTVAQSEHFGRIYQEKMKDFSVHFPWEDPEVRGTLKS